MIDRVYKNSGKTNACPAMTEEFYFLKGFPLIPKGDNDMSRNIAENKPKEFSGSPVKLDIFRIS